jgi:8-oxo-dGTP pyrophosphatase MutT (NUDIX family)
MMRSRPAARLLVLDPQDRVLLFQFAFRSGPLSGRIYWATPGGELESGETFEAAARRELEEETGVCVERVGPEIERRAFVLQLTDGEHVMAQERFFAVRVADTSIATDRWTEGEREVMAAHRWWTIEELSQTVEQVFPENLVALVLGELRNPTAVSPKPR